jgi:hypothetical protein
VSLILEIIIKNLKVYIILKLLTLGNILVVLAQPLVEGEARVSSA